MGERKKQPTRSEYTEKDGKVFDTSGTEVSDDSIRADMARIERMQRDNQRTLENAPNDMKPMIQSVLELATEGQAKTYEHGQQILKRRATPTTPTR